MVEYKLGNFLDGCPKPWKDFIYSLRGPNHKSVSPDVFRSTLAKYEAEYLHEDKIVKFSEEGFTKFLLEWV